jgi:hypothetical protein
MNPFQFVLLSNFATPPTDVEMSGIAAVLELCAEAYGSGFVRGPGTNEHDYVVRWLRTRFGDTPMVVRFTQMVAEQLGK